MNAASRLVCAVLGHRLPLYRDKHTGLRWATPIGYCDRCGAYRPVSDRVLARAQRRADRLNWPWV